MRKYLAEWLTFILFALLPVSLAGQMSNWEQVQEHFKRATEAEQARQYDTAVREFREVLRLDPHNAQAHANLGVIAFTEKNFAQAADEFRGALKLRPTLWNAEALLGMSELRLGRPQQAKAHLRESFQQVQDTKLQFEAGMDLISLEYREHEVAPALEILHVLERVNPDDPGLLYTEYRTYTEMAARALVALSHVAPDSAEFHRILAQTEQNQDDYSGAIAQYRKALELNPGMPGLHFELAQAILANSTDEPARQEAEKELKLAMTDDPADPNTQYMLGEIEWMRAKPEEAMKYYAEAVRLEPDFVDAHIALGRALTTLGRPQEALQQQSEAVRLDPQNEAAHYRLAQAYRKLGRMEDAEHELATFRKLRDARLSVQALFQRAQEGTVPHQVVGPNEPQ